MAEAYPATALILDCVLSGAMTRISELELLTNMPNFMVATLMCENEEKINTMVIPSDQCLKIGLVEQPMAKALFKDSMMPKGVNQESEEIDKMQAEPLVKTRFQKKAMFGTRSTFKNKSNVNVSSRTSNASVNSVRLSRKKKKDENLIAIQTAEEEDPELASLWKKKNAELVEKERVKKNQEARAKEFQEKRESFQKEFVQKNYTFDFDGGPVDYQNSEDKINLHALRPRFGQNQRNKRNNYQELGAELAKQIKIARQRKSLAEPSSETISFNLNIPVFDSIDSGRGSAFGIPTEVEKYHLKDYRKHYGGRYNRLQKSLNTIDITSGSQQDQFQSLFSGRKQLKDEQSLNQSILSYRSRDKSPIRRKLALPKIKGKYSTLDRYEQN